MSVESSNGLTYIAYRDVKRVEGRKTSALKHSRRRPK